VYTALEIVLCPAFFITFQILRQGIRLASGAEHLPSVAASIKTGFGNYGNNDLPGIWLIPTAVATTFKLL